MNDEMNNNNPMDNNMNEMNNNMPNNNEPQNGQMNNFNQYQAYPPKKTGLGVIIGIIVALVLVGAGLLIYFLVFNKKDEVLSCYMSQTSSGITLTASVDMNFKGGYFTGGTMSETVDGSTLTAVQMEAVKNTNLCKSVTASGNSAVSFTNCNQEVKGTNIVVTVKLVPGSAADAKVEVSEGKEIFEKQGFTCTIK